MTPPHEPARLAVFCPLYPPHIGGLESHAQQFNREMSARGYSIAVFTPLVTPNTKLTEQEGKVKIYRFPAFEIIPNYHVPKIWHPVFWKQLRHIHRFLKPPRSSKTNHPAEKTIIISRTRFFLTSLLAMITAKLMRLPWLHIEHGSDYVHLNNPIFSFLAYLYDNALGRFVFMSANALVANSKASATFIRKFVLNKRIAIIYRGVDNNIIHKIRPADLHHTYKIPPKTRIITYAGRLIDGKGVNYLLEAAQMLPTNNFALLIIGDGPQKDNLMIKASQISNCYIEFIGQLPWTKLISYIKASNLFINPSLTEGLPSSIIEAALCGTEVIATNVGGTAEIALSPNIHLIPPRLPKQLANEIIKLSKNPTIKRTSVQNKQLIAKRFSWPLAIKQYTEIISKL